MINIEENGDIIFMISIEEKEEYLKRKFRECPINDPEGINFYYKAVHDYNMGLIDADDYAWLNTLFRYDIGAERALEIIRWYYENQDTTVMDAVSIDQKETLKNICECELGLNLDFSHWPKTEPKYLEYGFEKEYRNTSETKIIWARIGMFVEVSNEDYERYKAMDDEMPEELYELFKEKGKFGGDSYIPEEFWEDHEDDVYEEGLYR